MASKERTTLQEIAKRANVSVASVSYALNGKGRISPKRRKMLEQMLREAGLKPRNRRHPVVYLYRNQKMSDIQSYRPLMEKHSGLNDVFNHHDLTLRLELLQEEEAVSVGDQLQMIQESRPGAVVLDTDLHEMTGPAADFFAERQIPAVQLGHTVRKAGCEAVVVDNFGGGQLAAEYLVSQGHERIGMIRWWTNKDPASGEKFAGFECGMRRLGRELRALDVVETAERLADRQPLPGRDAAMQLLEQDDPPTGVFVENSFVSPSLIYPNQMDDQAVWQRLSRIQMLHFEAWHLDWMDSALSQKLRFPPRNTTLLRIDWRQLGRIVAERLVARLDGEPDSGQTIRLMPNLVHVHGGTVSALEAPKLA